MNLWHLWLTLIQHTLAFCAVDLHLGMGLAIVLMTALVRTAFLPLTWAIARRAASRRVSLQRLKPALERLKQQFGGDRQRYAQKMMRLYQREGLTVLDGTGLFGALVQSPVFLGIFQVLRDIQRTGRFLWIANLARPDFWLAVIAGAATMVLMATNPELPEHLRLVLILVPALFAIIAALKVSAALSLYWTTTNAFSGAQAIVLRAVLSRSPRAAAPRR
jgi:YidC/Oxa1 family membrane protein insertase